MSGEDFDYFINGIAVLLDHKLLTADEAKKIIEKLLKELGYLK